LSGKGGFQELMKTHAIQADVAALGTVVDAISGLDEQQRLWVLQTAASRFALKKETSLGGGTPSGGTGSPPASGAGPAQSGGEASLKSFMKSKAPKTDGQRITCLAYYLTKFRDTAHFKTKDLTALNRESAWPNFSNPTVAVSNASRDKYLTPAGKGDKQLTNRGEEVVEALPDQEKVRSLTSGNSARKKRARKKK
jgi:hypothetical protein